MNNIEARLDRLERSLKWWRAACFALLAAVSVVVATGAQNNDVSEELKAKRLSIIDENGTALIQLATGKDGPHFDMQHSANGRGGKLSIFTTEELAKVQIGYGDKDPREGYVYIAATGKGNGEIVTFGNDGKKSWWNGQR